MAQSKAHQDIVMEARKNCDDAYSVDQHNRDAALDDLRFKIGEQWPEWAKRERESVNRPCLTFNELGKFGRQITGDARQNRPRIEVRPVDSHSDPGVAMILEDLTREIEHRSKAFTAYNTALDASSNSGFSYIIVTSQYSDEMSFDQELRIRRVTNQFAVFHDLTGKEFDGCDIKWALEADCVLSREEFKVRYPNGNPSEDLTVLPTGTAHHVNWYPEGAVRIGRYYKRVPVKKQIVQVQLPDGSYEIHESDQKLGEFILGPMGQPIGQIIKTRKVDSWKVKIFTITGSEVLEEEEWPGTTIPVVPVYGEETWVEGKKYLNGVLRFAKDPQRFKNFFLTSIADRLLMSHRNPYMGSQDMFEGYEQEWKQANVSPKPYIRFNPDQRVAGGRPVKDTPSEFSAGEMKMLEVGSQALYDTTGIYPPSLGQKSNEVSGRAIMARQKEADTGTFLYIDNRNIAIQRVGEILVEVIPKVYDSSRVIRVRGVDQRVGFIPVNAPIKGVQTAGGRVLMDGLTNMPVPNDYRMPKHSKFSESGFLIDAKTGAPILMNDLSMGRFDVQVTVGSAFGTKRQETSNFLLELIRVYPQAAPFVGDLIAKNLDIEEGEELTRRFQAMMQMAAMAQGGGAPAPGPNKAQDEFGNSQSVM